MKDQVVLGFTGIWTKATLERSIFCVYPHMIPTANETAFIKETMICCVVIHTSQSSSSNEAHFTTLQSESDLKLGHILKN